MGRTRKELVNRIWFLAASFPSRLGEFTFAVSVELYIESTRFKPNKRRN
jgi:hypothetical protein